MAIFRRRPLLLCCSVFLLACLVGFFLRATVVLIAAGGVLFAVALILCLWRVRRRDLMGVWIIAVALLLALMGLVRSHSRFYGGDAATLASLEGQTVTVTGTVTDRRGGGGFITSYSLELTSLDGEYHILFILLIFS